MSLTRWQIDALEAKLDARHVRQRTQGTMKLSYIEGWWAIHEANRIFGYGAWDRQTIQLECTWQGKRKTRAGPKDAASYIARVRVTVRAGADTIIREGTGSGSGFGQDVGEAHESAAKEAETDAMKRALITFGNPFGLALYDKTQAEVDREPLPDTEAKGQPVPPGPRGGKPKPERNESQIALEWNDNGEARAAVYPFSTWKNIGLFLDDLSIALASDPRAWDTNVNDIERVREKIMNAPHPQLIDKLQDIELQLEAQYLQAG